MSAAGKKAAPEKPKPPTGPRLSDSFMSGPAKVAGIARTTNGFCILEVEISPTGEVLHFELDESERYPQFVVARAKNRQRKLALEAQKHRGVPKTALAVQKLDSKGRVF